MRVYRYGLRPPTEGVEIVRAQLRLAWEYRRQLTSLARARRAVERAIEVRAGLDAELRAVADADAAVEAAARTVKAAKASRGRAVPKALRDAAKEARAVRKEAKARLRERRKQLREELQPERDAIHERWLSMRRSCRAASGLRHGTYIAVEDALDRACSDTPLWEDGEPKDPRWPRWTGEGMIGVQLQGGRSLGAVSDGDTFLRIRLEPDRYGRTGAKVPRYGTLYLRIGSNDDRTPIWAAWPLKMHRSIPDGSNIKRAYVSVRREGPWERWTVELTVDEPDGYRREKCGHGTVAVDIGWRRLGDGTLRVAAWHDEYGASGTVVLDAHTIGAIRKPEELRRVRDEHLNAMRPALCDRLRAQPGLPEWLRRMTVRRREGLPTKPQAIAAIAQWRSHARFAKLACAWSKRRWLGDDPAFELLERWRYHDHHLWEWESAQRNQALRRRRDQYRVWAAWLARTYGTIVLEDFDLRRVSRKPEPDEEQTKQRQRAMSWRQLASTSKLRLCILNAVKVRGGCAAKVDPKNTTRECPLCQHVETWDAAASIAKQPPCSSCGQTWDQDDAAAIVLLRRFEQSGNNQTTGGARAPKKCGKDAPEGESRWQRVARMRAEKEARMGAARKQEPKGAES